jgi:hypothetical protein
MFFWISNNKATKVLKPAPVVAPKPKAKYTPPAPKKTHAPEPPAPAPKKTHEPEPPAPAPKKSHEPEPEPPAPAPKKTHETSDNDGIDATFIYIKPMTKKRMKKRRMMERPRLIEEIAFN